jgi:hypothetical protein
MPIVPQSRDSRPLVNGLPTDLRVEGEEWEE